MDIRKGPKKLRKITGYLPGFIKFYSLKNEYIAPIVFIFILGAIFARYVLQPQFDISIGFEGLRNNDYKKTLGFLESAAFPTVFSYFLVVGASFVSRFVSALYLTAYIKDLKGEVYSLKSSLLLFFRNIHRIALTSVEFYVAVIFGLMILLSISAPIPAVMVLASMIIPGVAGFVFLKIVYIFSSCYVMDKGKGVSRALEASIRLTYGSRLQVLLILSAFVVFGGLITVLMVSLFSSVESVLVISFVYAFIGAILDIMQTRLVAQMYIDLEYGQAIDEDEVE